MLASVALLLPIGGATGAPDPGDSLERQIRYLQQQLAEIEQEASSITRDLDLLGTREALSRRLHLKAAVERDTIAEALRAEEVREAEMEVALASTRSRAAAALREIYKQSALAGFAPVLSVEDPRDLVRAYQQLDVVTRRRLSAIRSYAEQSRLSRDRQVVLTARRSELERAVAVAAEEERRLGDARQERLRLMERVERERTMHQEAAAELARAAREMQAMLESILPGADPPRLTVDLERLRGTLPWPAPGWLLRPFGERRHPRFGTLTPHPGWEIGIEPGAPVAAVAAGRVVFSHRFGGYGRTVVIDHGGRYLSVYARLGAATAAPGDDLLPGQELGFAAEAGPDGKSSVYFEIRHKGRALDPAAWLRRERREARP